MRADTINKWIARRWLGIVLASFFAGVLLTLVVVLIVLLTQAASAGDLPDLAITPGVAVSITTRELCKTKWGKDKRFVTAAMKRQVFASYGLSGNLDRSCKGKRHFEVDHLISRELGGADDVLNLWPQCYSGHWNATRKDRVENRLHKEVCAGHVTIERAQGEIKTDYRVPYRRYFGEPK